MRRRFPTSLAFVAIVVLVAACGSATPGGSSSTTPRTAYVNPTGGPLRTYATIEELTQVLSAECRWTIKHNDPSTPDSAWCEPESLDVALSLSGDPLTVEKLQGFLAAPSQACGWWDMMVFAYSLTRSGGSDLYSAAGITPSDLPQSTTSVETPAGTVQGGNWWTTYGTADEGERIAKATGGYLVPAPAGCPSATATTTPSAATEPAVCSGASTAFLAALVNKGLPGVTVETVEDRGPRMMDATTCMADYIAEADASTVETSLTAYLRSLGYIVTPDLSKDYITIVVAEAKDKPRVELQLPVAGEGSSDRTGFEILLADG